MTIIRAQITNDISEIGPLERRLDDVLESAGVSARAKYAARLAVEELTVNVIRYGFDDTAVHAITIEVTEAAGTLCVLVEDDGRPFDPTAVADPDFARTIEDRRSGGLGLYIVRKMAREVRYERAGGLNRVEVIIDR